MSEQGKDILRYADAAMYDSQPMLHEEGTRISPRVFLLSGTPDPLGNLAVDMRMYRGDPVYSLDEITDEQRVWAWEELMKTKLNTPLEGVQVKFMIEAVTRSFTHQMVRQRVGAYYVQESLRFAVKKGIAQECALPPSIITPAETMTPGHIHDADGTTASDVWHDTIEAIENTYEQLIALGIPAEDARGILPHCITTRIIYTTNLRALFEMVGNRLCTQAQFEWRAVVLGMMDALRLYGSAQPKHTPLRTYFPEGLEGREYYNVRDWKSDAWQWQLIATPRKFSFTPICYRLGTCAFMSMLDRGCTIRDRVLAFAEHGIPAEEWGRDQLEERGIRSQFLKGIRPEEWMGDPSAGVTTESNRPT